MVKLFNRNSLNNSVHAVLRQCFGDIILFGAAISDQERVVKGGASKLGQLRYKWLNYGLW